MMDKEDISRTIFGVGRADGSVLKSFTNEQEIAIPYPIQVSLQTQEFIQAVLFYAMFADTAAGAYVRLPNALSNIEKKLTEEGLAKREWERGWDYLQKYQAIFNNTIFQNVVILMRSHWDWYIRQVSELINFARVHVTDPQLK